MRITTYLPHPALRHLFRCYMVQQGFLDDEITNHLTAKGCGALMFPFREPSITTCRWASRPSGMMLDEGLLCGNSDESSVATYQGSVNFFFAIFQPTGIYHFLRDDARQCSNGFHTLADLNLSPLLVELQQRLWAVASPAEVLRLADYYLLRYVQTFLDRRRVQQDFSPIATHIWRREGNVKVEELAKKYRISSRWIEKQFALQVGLSPKIFSKVVRFQSVLRYLMRHPGADALDLVVHFDYTDQSHLIRDFNRFTGQTPRRFLTNNHLMDDLLHEGLA